MVSFLAEDGLVRISPNTTRQKIRNLINAHGADPRLLTRAICYAAWCCQELPVWE
jgi:hypothetical protein